MVLPINRLEKRDEIKEVTTSVDTLSNTKFIPFSTKMPIIAKYDGTYYVGQKLKNEYMDLLKHTTWHSYSNR